MKKLLIVFFFLPLQVSFAQNAVYDLPEKPKLLIEQGKKCLKNDKTNCKTFFDQAINASLAIKNDSILAQTYFEICNVLDLVGNSNDHINYARKGLTLDGKKHPLVTNRLLREIGYAYSKNGTIDSLIPIYKKAVYWAEYAKDSSEIAISRIRLASAYRRIGDIKTSIQLLLDTKPYVKASNDIHRESGLLFTLANAYNSNGDNELAISYFKEASEGFLKAGDKKMYAASLISIGIAANDIGNQQLALEKIPEAIKIMKIEENESGVLYGQSHLAYAYYLNGDIEKSIQLFKASILQSIKFDNKILENMNRRYLAQAYLDKNKNSLALEQTTLVYNEEKTRGISDAYLSALKLHAEALALNNKSDEAVSVYKDYITTKDSIFTKKKEIEITNLREQFESEKKSAQIKLLEKDISLSKLQKKIYAIGMISFLAIASLLYFGFKQKIKKDKIANQKQQEIYKQEIEFKKKELASQTLHLVQKNAFIQELKENLEKIKQSPELFKVEFRRIVMLLKRESAEDRDWEIFKSYFSEVHNDFDHKIKSINVDISEKEIRLASFLRMNLTTKQIASMLNVLPDSVLKSKYRLKKKLNLEKDQDLTEFLNSL